LTKEVPEQSNHLQSNHAEKSVQVRPI